jgi:phage gp36-like protein
MQKCFISHGRQISSIHIIHLARTDKHKKQKKTQALSDASQDIGIYVNKEKTICI